MNVTDNVEGCGWCNGHGYYRQSFNIGCGAGMVKMLGTCDHCEGVGVVYKGTDRPVPTSVIAQLQHAK